MTSAAPAREWLLAPGELVVAGPKAASHVGHEAVDAWWASLDEEAQAAQIDAGLTALAARNPDPGLREALRIRREAVRILLAETVDGAVVATHVAADGQAVFERVLDDFSTSLLLASPAEAPGLLAALVTAGAGANLQLIRVQVAGGWEVSVVPGDDGTWRWLSEGVGRLVATEDLPDAFALLLG